MGDGRGNDFNFHLNLEFHFLIKVIAKVAIL